MWRAEGPQPALAALLQDTGWGALPFPSEDLRAVNLWMNAGGGGCSIHYDPFHNLLSVVTGRKRVRLWSPAMSACLYPQVRVMRETNPPYVGTMLEWKVSHRPNEGWHTGGELKKATSTRATYTPESNDAKPTLSSIRMITTRAIWNVNASRATGGGAGTAWGGVQSQRGGPDRRRPTEASQVRGGGEGDAARRAASGGYALHP